MKRFLQLFRVLDESDRSDEKLAALQHYFAATPPEDAAWALHLLRSRAPLRCVTAPELRSWAGTQAGFPDWLVEECYAAAGELAETFALLLPASAAPRDLPLHVLMEERLLPLARASESARRDVMVRTWRELSPCQRFLYNKLATGGFRVRVASSLVARALAQVADVPYPSMSCRLMGNWPATGAAYQRLLAACSPEETHLAQPYPFHLACLLHRAPEDLGSARAWQAEWKWDGLRTQLIRRGGQTLLWSCDDELVVETFPEITNGARCLPEGTVLDGDILPWSSNAPLPWAHLQRRLGRRRPGTIIRREASAVFMAHDLLELDGADCRARPLQDRRAALEQILGRAKTRFEEGNLSGPTAAHQGFRQGELFNSSPPPIPSGTEAFPASFGFPLRLSPTLPMQHWDDLRALHSRARRQGAVGVLLKQSGSPYGIGREHRTWWTWSVEPFRINAVLMAAQPGRGPNASLCSEYSFGVWDGPQLLAVARASSGLAEEEIRQVDAFVALNTTGRHGPVRLVKPALVFELTFEGIQPSPRHKAGLSLESPRIAAWHHDKAAQDADTLDTLRGQATEAGLEIPSRR